MVGWMGVSARWERCWTESSSRSEGATTHRLGAALALIVTAFGCGGSAATSDPLASVAEAVREEERSPPPLAESWRRQPETPLRFRPAVGNTNVYVALENRLEAWSAANGDLLWPVELDSPISAAPQAIGSQVVVASTGTATAQPRIWWFGNDSTPVAQLPVDRPAYEISAVPGVVVYLDEHGAGRLGGGIEWHAELADAGTVELANDHGVAIVTTRAGELVAFDVVRGNERWRTQVAEQISRAHVSGERVYVGGSDQYVRAFRVADGTLAWERAVGAAIVGAPAEMDGVLWVAPLDSRLRALNADNGTDFAQLALELSSRNYLDISVFAPWAVVGARYGPWVAVRAPTRTENQNRSVRVNVRASGDELDLLVPAGTGPAGVAVVNGDGTLVFLEPQRTR